MIVMVFWSRSVKDLPQSDSQRDAFHIPFFVLYRCNTFLEHIQENENKQIRTAQLELSPCRSTTRKQPLVVHAQVLQSILCDTCTCSAAE